MSKVKGEGHQGQKDESSPLTIAGVHPLGRTLHAATDYTIALQPGVTE